MKACKKIFKVFASFWFWESTGTRKSSELLHLFAKVQRVVTFIQVFSYIYREKSKRRRVLVHHFEKVRRLMSLNGHFKFLYFKRNYPFRSQFSIINFVSVYRNSNHLFKKVSFVWIQLYMLQNYLRLLIFNFYL
jgi:hypothetical protein